MARTRYTDEEREGILAEFAVETAGLRGPRGEREPVAELILGEGALLLRVYQVPARS